MRGISTVSGLRSPVIKKIPNSQKTVYLYIPIAARVLPALVIAYFLKTGFLGWAVLRSLGEEMSGRNGGVNPHGGGARMGAQEDSKKFLSS